MRNGRSYAFVCLLLLLIITAGSLWKLNVFNFPANARISVDKDPIELVNQAQQLAQSGKLVEAIAVLDDIQPANKAEAETLQQIRDEWSTGLFKQAIADFNQGKFNQAIERAEQLSQDSAAFEQYRQVRKKWYEQSTVYQLAEQLHQQRRCTTALATLALIKDKSFQASPKVTQLKAAINATAAQNSQPQES